MTEQPTKRKWIGTVLKIIFFTTTVFLVIFVVMANLGGSSDSLKQSIEEFVADSTPFDARVERLNRMTFFPDISFDFEGMELSRKGNPDPVMVVSKVQVAFGFWDVMMSTGKVKAMNIRGFRALPGVLLDNAVAVDFIEITETTDDGPLLRGEALIGDRPVKITAGMNAKGLGKGKKYSFGKERVFEMTLGDIIIGGKMRTGESAGIVFENLDIHTADIKIATGRIDVVRNGERLDFGGQLDFETRHSDIVPNVSLYVKGNNPSGDIMGIIESTQFHVEDFSAGSGYDHLATTFEKMWGEGNPEKKIDIDLKIGTLYRGDSSKGSYDGPLLLKKGWHIDTAALKAAP